MLKDFLIANWSDLLGSAIPDSIHLVPITSCLEDYGNNIVLIFTDGSIRPDYVLKASRNPQFNFKIEKEYFNLWLFINNPNIESFIPKPLCIGQFNSCAFFIQSGINGTSLFKLLRKYGVNRTNHSLILQSLKLLADINKTNKDGNLESELSFFLTSDNYVDKRDNLFREYCLANPEIIMHLIQPSNISQESTTFFNHGDFWQHNILIQDKYISGVIDWEFGSPGSAQATDIIWFLINLAFCLCVRDMPNASIFDAFKWGFFQKGNQSKLLSFFFGEYISCMGMDFDFSSLLKATLLQLSMREKISYGRHMKMDAICQKMLAYMIENANKIAIH